MDLSIFKLHGLNCQDSAFRGSKERRWAVPGADTCSALDGMASRLSLVDVSYLIPVLCSAGSAGLW